MMKRKINTSTFCFIKKQDARNTLSDASCSDDESLSLLWDEECAAKFAAAEKKKWERSTQIERNSSAKISQFSKVSEARLG